MRQGSCIVRSRDLYVFMIMTNLYKKLGAHRGDYLVSSGVHLVTEVRLDSQVEFGFEVYRDTS